MSITKRKHGNYEYFASPASSKIWGHALRIAAIYVVVSVVWIIYTDYEIGSYSLRVHEVTRWQTYKGVIFVSFTSLLIFLLVWRQEWLNARLLAKLSESERALEHVFDLNPAVIFRLRVEENDIVPFWVSNNVTRVLGFSVAEVLKRAGGARRSTLMTAPRPRTPQEPSSPPDTLPRNTESDTRTVGTSGCGKSCFLSTSRHPGGGSSAAGTT